jgi:hypothetical protein
MALPAGFQLEQPAAPQGMALPPGFQLEGVMPAPAAPSGVPGPRQSYGAMEVPGAAMANLPASAKRFAGGLYEAITSPVQTLKAAADVAAGALQNVLPEKAVNFINQFDGNPEASKRAVEMANAVGGLYKERYGTYEGIKRTLAEDPVGAAADLSTLLTGGAAATGRVAPAVSSALKTAAVATNPLSVVTKPAQAVLAAKEKILPSAILKEKELNAVRDATLRAAQAEGYVATPGSVSPTGANVLSERMAGKTHLEQLASVQNQTVTDRLARRAVGIRETAPLTSDAMKDIRKAEYTKGYEPIKNLGPIKTDQAYLDDLINLEASYTGPGGSFPGAVPETVSNLVKTFTADKFDAKDAVKVTQTLREQAKSNFFKGDNDLAKSQIGIANALENQIERSLTAAQRPDAAKLLEQFRLSRQRMAVSHTIEDAIKEGSGTVMASKLARDIQSGKYVSGDVKTIAEFANVFPRVMQSPSQIGTPASGSILGRGLTGAAGAGVGYAIGGETGGGIGAAMGAMAPEMISAGMRNYLLSERGQRNMIPNYSPFASRLTSDEAARNALMMQRVQEATNPNRIQLNNMAPGRP